MRAALPLRSLLGLSLLVAGVPAAGAGGPPPPIPLAEAREIAGDQVLAGFGAAALVSVPFGVLVALEIADGHHPTGPLVFYWGTASLAVSLAVHGVGARRLPPGTRVGFGRTLATTALGTGLAALALVALSGGGDDHSTAAASGLAVLTASPFAATYGFQSQVPVIDDGPSPPGAPAPPRGFPRSPEPGDGMALRTTFVLVRF